MTVWNWRISNSWWADLVFLDLEDACAPQAKESARGTAVSALTELDWGTTLRAVRVNGLETQWCHGDIVELVTGARELDVIIVPKVRSGRDIWWVDVLLTQLESKLQLSRPIALEALIEEAEGLVNVAEIARASPRLEALIFGAGDLSASLRSRVDGNFEPAGEYPGDFWHAVRIRVLAAARAADIDAIDAPYPAYRDVHGYRRNAKQASLLGFDGKWAIHPAQVPVANAVFTPAPEEVAEARSIISDYRRAQAGGLGALGRNGKLVDAALMRHPQNVLNRAGVPVEAEADSVATEDRTP
jgi:citrate lyase subunit beta / citryl-CoA lyase